MAPSWSAADISEWTGIKHRLTDIWVDVWWNQHCWFVIWLAESDCQTATDTVAMERAPVWYKNLMCSHSGFRCCNLFILSQISLLSVPNGWYLLSESLFIISQHHCQEIWWERKKKVCFTSDKKHFKTWSESRWHSVYQWNVVLLHMEEPFASSSLILFRISSQIWAPTWISCFGLATWYFSFF